MTQSYGISHPSQEPCYRAPYDDRSQEVTTNVHSRGSQEVTTNVHSREGTSQYQQDGDYRGRDEENMDGNNSLTPNHHMSISTNPLRKDVNLI